MHPKSLTAPFQDVEHDYQPAQSLHYLNAREEALHRRLAPPSDSKEWLYQYLWRKHHRDIPGADLQIHRAVYRPVDRRDIEYRVESSPLRYTSTRLEDSLAWREPPLPASRSRSPLKRSGYTEYHTPRVQEPIPALYDSGYRTLHNRASLPLRNSTPQRRNSSAGRSPYVDTPSRKSQVQFSPEYA